MPEYSIRYKTKGYDYTEVGGEVIRGVWRTLMNRHGEVGVYTEAKADELVEAFESIGVKVKKVRCKR